VAKDRREAAAPLPLPFGRKAAWLIFVLGGGSALAAVLFPLNEFDAMFHFALKGKVLYFTGNPLDEIFTDVTGLFGRIHTHRNYPLGIPFLEAYTAHAGFGWSERWVELPLAFWALCIPAAVSLGLRIYGTQAARAGAIAAACLPILFARDFPIRAAENFSAGLTGSITAGAGTDQPLGAYLAVACALLLHARAAGSIHMGVLGGITLAMAVFVKNEGLALAAATALALVLGAPLAKARAWKASVVFLAVTAVLAAPWMLHRAQLPALDENYSEIFTLDRIVEYAGRSESVPITLAEENLGEETRVVARPVLAAEYMGIEFVNIFSWGLFWVMFWCCLPFGRSFRDGEARWVALLTLGGLLLYFLVLVITPWSLFALYNTGIPARLLIHLIGPAALVIGRRFGSIETATPSVQ
jgi:hypothetical protein